MQEAGLLATLRSLWVDARALQPAVVIKARAMLEGRDIPDGLKPVILRIGQMTLDFAEQIPAAGPVAWVLERDDQTPRLSIDMAVEGTHLTSDPSPPQPGAAVTALDLLDAIRARVMLSGGSSDCSRSAARRRTIVSTWQA